MGRETGTQLTGPGEEFIGPEVQSKTKVWAMRCLLAICSPTIPKFNFPNLVSLQMY